VRIVLCGPLLPENIELLLSEGSPATGRFLRNLVEGINFHGIETIPAAYITIPMGSNKSKILNIAAKQNGLFVFKDKFMIASIMKFRRKLLQLVDKDTIVIFYNECYAYLGLTKKVIKKGGKPILILADHTEPQEYGNPIRKLLTILCEKEFSKFIGVILLSHCMKNRIKNNAPIKVMEGGIKSAAFKDFKLPAINERVIIMYSGSLSPTTGVDILLEAIQLNERKDIEFHISGKGELRYEVDKLAKSDSRVKYLGFINSEEYHAHLEKAHILVNPRNMNYKQNANNFPSKVLEYLASGRPTISTRFPGYERFEQAFRFFDGTAVGLNDEIDWIIENYNSYSNEKYNANRRFAGEFEWSNQAKRIINFLQVL
jgi:glycosyltransferase involved in cell wall biosynthesis